MSACEWTYKGLPCELKTLSTFHPLLGNGGGEYHCGYVTLPRPVDDDGYRGVASGVDVHGGITYAQTLNYVSSTQPLYLDAPPLGLTTVDDLTVTEDGTYTVAG